MAIDPRIALGVQPMQIENPVNQLAKVLQIKDMQQGQQMNALKMDEYRRSVEDGAALRSALSAPDADPYKVLLSRGKVKEATDFMKGKADVEKTGAETEAKKIEAAHKRVDLMGQSLGWLRQNPSVENAQMLAQYWQANGVADPQKVQAMLAQVRANPTPQAIAQFADMGFRAALSTKEQLPKLQTNNIGGATVTQQFDPVTGKVLGQSAIQNTVSPDAVMTDNRVRAEGAANRGVTIRGQDLVNARAKEQNQVQAGQKTQAGVIELRKEFNALPEVKNFKEVLPIIQSVQRAPDTPAGDIDLIYGVGKIMDPNSVVREGEMNLVIKSGSPAQRLQGYVNYVKGGGRLSPGQRQELMAVMQSRVQGLQSNYEAARRTYETAADRGGLPKDQIFIENAAPAAAPPAPSAPTALPSGWSVKVK